MSALIFEPTRPLDTKEALSILEKLHVPDGWCSSGFKANEYTAIVSFKQPLIPI